MSKREWNEAVRSVVEKSDGGVGNPGEILGLVGGLGVAAAIHYYREIAKSHTAAGRPLQMLMVHADVQRVAGHVRRGETAELADYLAGLIGRMAAGGATFAVIPAVTPHICYPELAPRSPLPLLSMLDVAAREIRSRGFGRVALFGTRYVIESGMFGMLPGVDLVRPGPQEIDTIHNIYFGLVENGRESPGDRERLIALAETLRKRDGVEAIVLAGTDLALVFDETNTPFPALDCARAHIDAILASLLAKDK